MTFTNELKYPTRRKLWQNSVLCELQQWYLLVKHI